MSSNQDDIQSLVSVGKTNKGSAVKGIIYGTLIDLGGTLLFGFLFGVIYMFVLMRRGIPMDEIMARLAAMDSWSWQFVWLNIVGVLMSFVAGYVCAKQSITNIYRNSAILSLISCGSLFLLNAVNGLADVNSYLDAEEILSFALTIAAIFLGSYCWKKRNMAKIYPSA